MPTTLIWSIIFEIKAEKLLKRALERKKKVLKQINDLSRANYKVECENIIVRVLNQTVEFTNS